MSRKTGHLSLIAVGKMRQQAWQVAQQEYVKRLTRYTDFSLIEVKDVVGKGQPDSVAMKREGEQLLKAARNTQRIVLLSPEGRQMSSPGLASFVRKQIEGYGRIAFLIGGPLGFADEVIAAAHTQIALSHLTFTHELARVIFLEQLYRAFTIINGEKYHK